MKNLSKEKEWILNYVTGKATTNELTDDMKRNMKSSFAPNDEDEMVLYRGYFFETETEFKRFLTQIEDNGMMEIHCSSWTTDKVVAMDFMYGSGYSYYHHVSNEQLINGFTLLISGSIPEESILFSHLEVLDSLEGEEHDYQQAIKNLKNEEEFLVDDGKYSIEIDRCSLNGEQIIHEVLGENHPSICWIEFGE